MLINNHFDSTIFKKGVFMSEKVKAMVMAAGIGSRLEPLTLRNPKPLIPVLNRPLMDIILSQLASIDIKDVISNTYYLADQIIDRYKKNNHIIIVLVSALKEKYRVKQKHIIGDGNLKLTVGAGMAILKKL